MLPTATGLDGNAVCVNTVDRAAGFESESSHGVTVLGGLEGVNPSEGAGAPWERINQRLLPDLLAETTNQNSLMATFHAITTCRRHSQKIKRIQNQ